MAGPTALSHLPEAVDQAMESRPKAEDKSMADTSRADTSRRARPPDLSGEVVRGGVSIHYDVYGDGPTTVVLLPAWSIVDSRMWKAQVPFLARHYRVVTFDGRGSGRSDRPPEAADYQDREYVADAVAVLDATGTQQCVLVGFSRGAEWAVRLTAAERLQYEGYLAREEANTAVLELSKQGVTIKGDRPTNRL